MQPNYKTYNSKQTEQLPPDQLAPLWKMFILNDGLMTSALSRLTSAPIKVEIIREEEIKVDNYCQSPLALPNKLASLLKKQNLQFSGSSSSTSDTSKFIRRQVFLRCGVQPFQILAHAISYWPPEKYKQHMSKKSQAIGKGLKDTKKQLF